MSDLINKLLSLGVYYWFLICVGVSVFLMAWLFLKTFTNVPEQDRTYMDPLGYKLTLIWPFVQVIALLFCTNLPNAYLASVEEKMHKTGVSYLMTAEQFTGLRIFLVFLMPLLTWIALVLLGKSYPLAIMIAPLIGFFFPLIWLGDMRKKRVRDVIIGMPVYLDFITMSVEAGLNLSGALQQAVDNGPKGALRSEFTTILRDLRAGIPRSEALKRMARRLQIPEVTGFVSAITQAEKLGSSMAGVLRIQAEQRRTERFQRAEKMAMEAPVKLVFPLVIFIFPVTFLILGFPIIMKFLNEGVI
ncbi:MAG: tight adherence protein C [Saprospiraceae bacterium]|jgi:tight adherence protein C